MSFFNKKTPEEKADKKATKQYRKAQKSIDTYAPKEVLIPYDKAKQKVLEAIDAGYAPDKILQVLEKYDPKTGKQIREDYLSTDGWTHSRGRVAAGLLLGSSLGTGMGFVEGGSNLAEVGLRKLKLSKAAEYLDQYETAASGEIREDIAGISERGGEVFDKGKKVGRTTYGIAAAATAGAYTRGFGLPKLPVVPKFLLGTLRHVAASALETEAAISATKGREATKGELTLGLVIDTALALPELYRGLSATKMGHAGMRGAARAAGFNDREVEILTRPENRKLISDLLDQGKESAKYTELPTNLEKLGDDIYVKFVDLKKSRELIGDQLGEVYKNSQAQVSMHVAKQELSDAMDDFDIVPVLVGKGKQAKYVLTEESFKDSIFKLSQSDKKLITELYDEVTDRADFVSPNEAWTITKQFEKLLESKKISEALKVTEEAEVPAIRVISKIREGMMEAVPETAALSKEYATVSQSYLFLNKKLGEEGARGASLVKSLFSPQRDARLVPSLKVLEEYTGENFVKQADIGKMTMDAAGDVRGENVIESITGVPTKVGLVKQLVRPITRAAGLPTTKQIVMRSILKAMKTASPNVPQGALEIIIRQIINNLIKVGAFK